MLTKSFFADSAKQVAIKLLGKILCVKYKSVWLKAQVIETEAYYLNDKASHASLGFTEKRKALFMSAGTIYMYHSRGGPSLNVSCKGAGNAVLIKAAIPFCDPRLSKVQNQKMIETMQKLNPGSNNTLRVEQKLCSGQALLCKSLGLKVKTWDQKQFSRQAFYLADLGFKVSKVIQTTRLGIKKGRDEHLPLRFIDYNLAAFCTKNPLRCRSPK
jgi:DNA-3-methyladenine glycosylase